MCLKHLFDLEMLREIIRHTVLFSFLTWNMLHGEGCKLFQSTVISRCKVYKVSEAARHLELHGHFSYASVRCCTLLCIHLHNDQMPISIRQANWQGRLHGGCRRGWNLQFLRLNDGMWAEAGITAPQTYALAPQWVHAGAEDEGNDREADTPSRIPNNTPCSRGGRKSHTRN